MAGADWDIFHSGTTVEVLDAKGCMDIVGRLMSVADNWQERRVLDDQIHIFHTLGAASYLDPAETYARVATAANPHLR